MKYFLTDHLGSTNGLVDSSGNLTASNSYDSFGNATNVAFPTRYQFTNREFDSFTSLYYYRARFYDANLGRFISEDPIGFAGGDINLYGYVKNKPLKYRDPRGLDDADRIFEETYFPEGYEKWYRDNGIGEAWRKAIKEHDSQPENYRCGPGYFDFPLSAIPQHPFGYNFKETGCFNHDVCYETCGKKKSECDKAILDDLQNECMSKGNIFEKSRCLFAARVYFDAVDIGGGDAYNQAQKDKNCCTEK